MTNPFPLLIIMATIMALVTIQRALTRIDDPTKEVEQKEVKPPTKPKPRGIPFLSGLSVIGLNERGADHLKSLIQRGDVAVLSAYLASHRPGILELDDFLKELRISFFDSLPDVANKSDPYVIHKAIKTFTLPTPPTGISFKQLDIQEYEASITFDPNSQRLVTRDIMTQFGGHSFDKCFEYYRTHEKSAAMHISSLNPDREIIEILTDSGIADKGRHIPLPIRLTVLKMNQLRQMCKDLNHDTKFTRKQDATEALAKMPGSAVLLSMQYVVDDLFVLNPIDNEASDIKREWSYLSAYAKLLISKTTSDNN